MSDVTTAAGLAGFLLERIAEDEEFLRAKWQKRGARLSVHYERGEDPDVNTPLGLSRQLAECDAKRRIVELHDDDGHPHRVPMPWPDAEVISWKCAACGAWCSDGPSDGACPVDWRPPPMTLRLLALPYAGHPDFREEWRA